MWKLLAGGLIAFFCTVGVAFGQSDDAIGVVALVNPDASLQRATDTRTPQAGEDVFLDDRMLTDAAGQVHLMLIDKSSFTVGPNSDVAIDRFVYDPIEGTGNMAMSAARGIMRFVGGDISKQNPVEIQTSIGTLGIRGGILLLSVSESGGISAVFSFGTSLSFTDSTGAAVSQVVRPGFQIQVSPAGVVSAPTPAPTQVVSDFLAALEAPRQQTGQGPDEATGQLNQPTPEVTQAQTQALQIANQVAAATGGTVNVTQNGDIIVEFDGSAVTDTVEEQIVNLVENIAQATEESGGVAINVTVLLRHPGEESPTGYLINTNGLNTDLASTTGTLANGAQNSFTQLESGTINVSNPSDANTGRLSVQVNSSEISISLNDGQSVDIVFAEDGGASFQNGPENEEEENED